MKIKKCLFCGKEFSKIKGRSYRQWERKKYCSHPCYLKYSQEHPLSEEARRRIGVVHKGEKHHNWKGDKANYETIHLWLHNHYGHADRCESSDCNGKSKRYQWALKKGKEYSRNPDDYLWLCHPCHSKYDRKWVREERKCLCCKKVYMPKYNAQKFCSLWCAGRHNRNWDKKDNAKYNKTNS